MISRLMKDLVAGGYLAVESSNSARQLPGDAQRRRRTGIRVVQGPIGRQVRVLVVLLRSVTTVQQAAKRERADQLSHLLGQLAKRRCGHDQAAEYPDQEQQRHSPLSSGEAKPNPMRPPA